MDNREWKVVLSIETQLKRIADALEKKQDINSTDFIIEKETDNA
tara:strand:- start:382 stop:513 length:132 start_codon:yes stop_codon:yes gene_type:complete